MTTTRLPFTTETPVGTITNMGTFTGFDEAGYAHFVRPDGRKGWSGPAAFTFIQVLA